MATVTWTPLSATQSCYSGDVAWSNDTTVTLPADKGSCVKNSLTTGDGSSPFAAIHDGCYINNIRVEWTGSKSSFATNLFGYADFVGVTAAEHQIGLTGSALYYAEGGAGTLPSLVRGGTVTRYCRNNDPTYSATIYMSMPSITITYTDNGIPHTLFFGSNF